jgi:transposase
MDIQAFFTKILGLTEQWEVTEIAVDEVKKRLDVFIRYAGEVGICPRCGKKTPLYDKRVEREWRDKDCCSYQTYIHCRVPRIECGKHKVKTMRPPWWCGRSGFTKGFERFAIDALLSSKNRSKTRKLLQISWEEIDGIMRRGVRRGEKRRRKSVIRYLGIDEKSFLRGHKYVTVLTDSEGKRVLEVAENRDTESADKVFNSLSKRQLGKVEGISMDFWQAYRSGAEERLGKAEIIHDKFHIMKQMNAAVDAVRAGEHRERKRRGDETLTGTKYVWLKRAERFTKKDKEKWLELKKKKEMKVWTAWRLREKLRKVWEIEGEGLARKKITLWYREAIRSGLKPVKKVAEMIRGHFERIVSYWRHRVTNGYAEGINGIIQELKAVARGFRSFRNYRDAILFYCGKLDLYPH